MAWRCKKMRNRRFSITIPGLTQEEFEHLSLPYNRKDGQKESGSGLGLIICIAILHEHGFTIKCEKNEVGTKLTIKIK